MCVVDLTVCDITLLLNSGILLLYYTILCIYERNQSGCEKAKNMGFLPFFLWVFLTFYFFVALMKITMCFRQLEANHIMSWDCCSSL